jgi:Transglycosylase SLT domain
MLKTQFAKVFYLCNSLLLATVPLKISQSHNSTQNFKGENNGTEKPLLEEAGKFSAGNYPATLEFNPTNKSAQSNSKAPQITMNRKEMLFARKYIENSSGSLVSAKKRSSIPFGIIDSVFKKYDLPVELKYLAVIESELKPTAISRVGARGPWQIMPATAHILGLKTSRQCDERTNYYKSTIAAAKYLRDLYVQFDDWLLVLAAYNGGPRPVLTAMQESGSKNFWVLQDFLPAESREHVKKFIATHYYFEGRGSETTLTRAENKKFREMTYAFARSHYTPVISANRRVNAKYTYLNSNDLAIISELKLPIGFELYETAGSLNARQNISVENESSETKFKRLMRESEESLKKSGKIM